MEVICTGKLSTYAGSSRYQIIVEQVELAGLGALMAMLEERRKKRWPPKACSMPRARRSCRSCRR